MRLKLPGVHCVQSVHCVSVHCTQLFAQLPDGASFLSPVGDVVHISISKVVQCAVELCSRATCAHICSHIAPYKKLLTQFCAIPV